MATTGVDAPIQNHPNACKIPVQWLYVVGAPHLQGIRARACVTSGAQPYNRVAKEQGSRTNHRQACVSEDIWTIIGHRSTTGCRSGSGCRAVGIEVPTEVNEMLVLVLLVHVLAVIKVKQRSFFRTYPENNNHGL